jgi:hypothetical protein
LELGRTNDIYEQQAERIAAESATARKPAWSIARMGPQEQHSGVDAPASVHETLRSPGQRMDPETRDFFEPLFAHDFGSVQVHADASAARSAREVGAQAYSSGNHIVLGEGPYAIGQPRGLGVMAHELTHVVQQSGGRTGLIQRQLIPVPGSPVPLAGPYSGYQSTPPTMSPSAQKVPNETPEMLAKDLRWRIGYSSWKEIRKREYPRQSAAGIARAKERKAGTRADLTGLGKIKGLESFASAMHGIQTRWGKEKTATPDNRVDWVGKATDDALVSANVPKLLDHGKEDMKPRGYLSPSEWKFVVQEDTVKQPTLTDDSAADLANTALHECRHAEQHYTAARYAAGVDGMDAAHINTEQGLEVTIAQKAVDQKMDAKTDPAVKALGATMKQSLGVDSTKNDQVEVAMTDELKTLDNTLADATTAATNLEAKATPDTIAAAKSQREAVKKEASVVAKKYAAYRGIPHEADAHEVGDAEEQAFRGWR